MGRAPPARPPPRFSRPRHLLCLPRAAPQIIPLLTELRGGNLVGNVEALTQVAAEAAADIQRLQVSLHFLDGVDM